MQKHGRDLANAPEDIKRDKEVVLAAVKKNGMALQYAAEEMRSDKEVVLAAEKENGGALIFAAEELKLDKDFILEAVKINGTALEHAADALRGDRDFLLEAVKATKANWLLQFCSEELRQDEELKEQVAKTAGEGLIFTYYDNFNCALNMRGAFMATGASVPGGPAYDEVMKQLNSTPGGAPAAAMNYFSFKCCSCSADVIVFLILVVVVGVPYQSSQNIKILFDLVCFCPLFSRGRLQRRCFPAFL